MKTHEIVSVRLPISSTDLKPNPPVPPFRLTPSTLEQRAMQQLTQYADLYALFSDLCQTPIMAESAKEAAEKALDLLSGQLAAAWTGAAGSKVSIVRDQIVYRKLPNGQHETIGYLMETKNGGTPQPVVVDVDEGADRYHCFVHVSLAAREAASADPTADQIR